MTMTKEQAYQELDEAENELFTLKESGPNTPTALKQAREKVAMAYTRWLTFDDDGGGGSSGAGLATTPAKEEKASHKSTFKAK